MLLSSQANHHVSTEGSIWHMGFNLAQEVIQFINENLPVTSLARLSFVAHSLGGLIVRASLPHLH